MATPPGSDAAYLRAIFDTLPSMVLVVDDDVRILDYNEAAAALVGSEPSTALRRRMGDVLYCLHSADDPEGCGHGAACHGCIVRNTIGDVAERGGIARRRAKLEIVRNGRATEFYALVTARRLEGDPRRVLVVIDDISEMTELQRIVTVCMRCKKVRIEREPWQQVEAYFKRHWDLDFSHGFCPDCAAAEMARFGLEPGKP